MAGSIPDPSLADRVEESERRPGDRLGHERANVVLGDLTPVEVEERELFQLGDGELALPATVDVSFAHEPAETPGDLRRAALPKGDRALPRAILDPADHPRRVRRHELARLATA